VTEVLRAPFWHFCHPVGWRIWKNHTPFSVLHNYTRESFFILPTCVNLGSSLRQ
jgi:hypothetical protein